MRAPEAEVARIAALQGNVVAREQCRAAGLTRRQVQHRLATSRWREVHGGVYALGPAPLTDRGRYHAALLAIGPAAVLSHRSAASLWGLQPHHRSAPEVTTPAKRRSPRGIGVHWTRRLDRHDVTVRHGIRVTTLSRTLVDLAEVASPDELEEAIRAAERLHRLERTGLTPIPGRHGTRRLIARRPLVRGHLEPVFLRIVEEAGLSRPETNVPVAGYVVDALWRDARVAIEVDDFDTHRHRDAFERDRVRDRILTIAGLTPVRVTHADLTDGRRTLVDHLRALGIR